MRNRKRLAIIAGIVVIIFVIFTVGTTIVLNLAPKAPHAPSELSSVTYRQTKAVEGWDDSTHTTSDPAQLQAMHDVLVKDGWQVGKSPARNAGCTGGLETQLELSFTDGLKSQFSVYRCGGNPSALTGDISDLVSSWRS